MAQPIRRAGQNPRAVILFLLVMAATLGLDLGLKSWSFTHVAGQPVVLTDLISEDHLAFWQQYPREPTVVLPGLLNLRLTTNTGAVFGLGKGNRVLFVSVSVLATAVIGLMFWRSPGKSWGLHLALALILAGALGNLYDRVRFAAVRDMLHMLPDMHLPFGWSWPGGVSEVWPWIFNPADVALRAGVGLVLIVTWRAEAQAKKAASKHSETNK